MDFVEVRQCRANDAIFGKATQVQVSVLKKGETERCRASIQALVQFDILTIDFKTKDNALHLQWLSNTELKAWHRSFGRFEYKNYIGPTTQYYKHSKPVNIIFEP